MMKNKKRHWFWNILILLTLVVVLVAFVTHYKNWTKIEANEVKILSGIYYVKLNFSDIDDVTMVPKIPAMERINGFSVKETEKGVFKDSISGNKAYVYVDKLSSSKIRVSYQDSLRLYLNFTDSTKTASYFQLFQEKLINSKK